MAKTKDQDKAADGTGIIRHDAVEPKLAITPNGGRFRKTGEAVYKRLCHQHVHPRVFDPTRPSYV